MKRIMLFLLFIIIILTIQFPTLVNGSNIIVFDTKRYDKDKGKPVTYTDTFSVGDATQAFTLHVWQGENGLSMAKNGNITLNDLEVISSKELRNVNGYISKTVNLQPDNTLTVELKGKSGVFLNVRITRPTGPNDPYITISSPIDGDTVNRESVLVSGALSSSFEEVSVNVNGRIAEVNNGEYFTNNIPLVIGENTITATIIEPDGYKVEEEIVIWTDTQSQPIRLSSNITSGTPPLTVYFQIDTEISDPVTTYQMDFEGDGTMDYTADNADDVSFTFNSEGLYNVIAIVTDDQGGQYSGQIAINIISTEELDTLLTNKRSDALGLLKDKDVQNALTYFTESSQAKYEEAFTLLIDQLPDIFSVPEEFNLISIIDNVATCENVVLDDDGVTRSYPSVFIKDETGLWKIRTF